VISSQEIERYKQFALTVAASGDRVSAKEENLAQMVINLVQAIDHLCASMSLTAVTETGIQAGQHKWTGCRRGGSPAEADSYEWVRYCEVCGMEDTCEDPLPPCEGA